MIRPAGGFALDGIATIARRQEDPHGGCYDCAWHRDGDGDGEWLAVRAAARRHAASTGHRVTASVRDAYTYGPASDAVQG